MPPILAKSREKTPKAPSHKQNATRQHRLLLLIQGHQFMWNHPQEVQTQQAPSPPQPQEAPQPEETSADVLEQTADPVSPIMPSVVPSE